MFLPAFSAPIVVDFTRRGREFTINAKRLSGQGGYDPGTIAEQTDRHATPEQWQQVTGLLNAAKAWSLPSEDWISWDRSRKASTGWAGTDGEMWIVELADENRWHAVDRWSDVDGSYREACIQLLRLSGFFSETELKDLSVPFLPQAH